MVKVSATEFEKNVGRYEEVARTQPVTVTRDGRDLAVLISAEEYQRLKTRDRRVMTLSDFTPDEIAAIERAEPPVESALFDHEVE